MWGYIMNGKCVATNPNDMSGNSGWEEVPDDTVPMEIEETPTESPVPLEQRVEKLEASLTESIEALNILLGE